MIVGNQQVNGCCRPHPRLKSCSLQRLQLYMFSIQRFFDMKTFSDMKTFFDMKTFSLGRITQDFFKVLSEISLPHLSEISFSQDQVDLDTGMQRFKTLQFQSLFEASNSILHNMQYNICRKTQRILQESSFHISADSTGEQ